ncbi:30S ribosomal protein S18 [Candidatus Clavichlamydia salmonicola]|uniref:30S ribosomal protein S18 n=1 Tax=Candidatus Clavichlamydia salmonicola TaxID=469812 RepID=UPI0018917D11|nr:30S ribosomal protein S18 [Candidatus Clavichlamydia salmonicola]
MNRVNRSSGDSRKKRFNKKCPFRAAGHKTVDYKNTETLKRFITEKGKILPRRITGVSPRFQRLLTQAIKRSRYIGLLPFVGDD